MTTNEPIPEGSYDHPNGEDMTEEQWLWFGGYGCKKRGASSASFFFFDWSMR